MGQANINKAKFLRPDYRKTLIKKCAVCNKLLWRHNKTYLCSNHYMQEREINRKAQGIHL